LHFAFLAAPTASNRGGPKSETFSDRRTSRVRSADQYFIFRRPCCQCGPPCGPYWSYKCRI
jgi:hypothetical protein